MKAILFACLAGLALAAALPALKHAEYEFVFDKWAAQHGKEYSSNAERALRLEIFKANLDYIRKHEAKPKRTWELRMNKFGDLHNAEFKAMVNGYRPIKRSHLRNLNVKKLDVDVATSVNWVTKGVVAPIKDQGQCGSCWAFSAVGAMESLHAITKGSIVTLSEQQLVDCAGAEGNQGCEGGLMDQAFQYVMDNKGITTETAYPYTATDGTCKCTSANACSDAVDISSFTDVAANSSSALIAAINLQPISVAVDASGMDWQFYSGGVVTDAACGTELDHGVIAVGYDTGASQPYYLVRNSWGASWGEQGYIRIGIADGAGICGIQMDPSYPDGATRVAKKLPKFAIRKH